MQLHPSLFCLFFCLLYFFLPPFKDNGLLSGCLMSSAGIQKLFCGIYSVFKCSFDEFVGEKVVSRSYSSTILTPPSALTLFADDIIVYLETPKISTLYSHLFLFGTRAVAVLCWSSRENIPHAQGKRNPSKTVGVARGQQRADTLKPYSQKTSQSNHTRTTPLSNSMNLSHAIWGHPRWAGHGGRV